MYRWSSSSPLYRQVADHVAASILDSGAQGVTPLPSVRQLARTYMVNPLTVSRALECLRERGWIEVRQGIGSFVCDDAKERIVQVWRTEFTEREWPVLREKLQRLDLGPKDLC